jgi:hypothetical protein
MTALCRAAQARMAFCGCWRTQNAKSAHTNAHCAAHPFSALQGGCFVWGTNTNTQMAKGGDDSDNMQPKRIGRTARFRPELEVVQLAFGSQVRSV